MLAAKVGLVDTTGTIDTATLAAAAAALNIQVTRDLSQFWPVAATVSYLPDYRNIPPGYWPVQLVRSLPQGEGGFHMTAHNQPYAKVIATPGTNEWTVDASHEIIEMLVDPYGNWLLTSISIEIADGQVRDGAGRFEFLVEACDPCEGDPYTYQIDGISVSDFITPHFYDPQATIGTRYSFTGAIKYPRQILPGGYVSWVDPATLEMQQILWVDQNEPPQWRNLGRAPGGSLRLHVEAKTHGLTRENRKPVPAEARATRAACRERLDVAGRARARHYV
jgi:hypothetical protein